MVTPNAAWDAAPIEPAPPPPREEEAAPAPFLHEPLQAEFSSPRYGMEPPAPTPPAPTSSTPEPPSPAPPTAQAASAASAAPPKRAYGAEATGGRSVAQLFKGMLLARPPAQASAAPVRQTPAHGSPGAPTRPASRRALTQLGLRRGGIRNAARRSRPGPGAGSVSFDDFFELFERLTRLPDSASPDPKTDDLDQFHAWLQNLKR